MGILATIKSDAEKVESFVVAAGKDAPTAFSTAITDVEKVGAIVEIAVPGAASVVNITTELLTLAEDAVVAAGSAASSPLSVTLDTTLVNAVKSLVAAAKKA